MTPAVAIQALAIVGAAFLVLSLIVLVAGLVVTWRAWRVEQQGGSFHNWGDR